MKNKFLLVLFMCINITLAMFPTNVFASDSSVIENNKTLTCLLDEYQHNDDCYTLICEEIEQHEHNEECFDLECEIEEHLHSEECYEILENTPIESVDEVLNEEVLTVEMPLREVQLSTGSKIVVTEALELIEAIENASTSENTDIYIQGDIEIESTIIIDKPISFKATDGPASILRKDSFTTATLIQVTKNGTLSIYEGVTIDGNDIELFITGDTNALALSVEGKLILEGGRIRHHKSRIVSPVVILDGGEFIINEGDVSRNTLAYGLFPYLGGGAIKVWTGGTLTMNGGEIDSNIAHTYGGAILVYYKGTFNLNGGTIHDNHLTHQNSAGGGIYVYDGATFIMNGGIIYKNTCEQGGGGICFGHPGSNKSYVSKIELNKGSIYGNMSGYFGGGIYVPASQVPLNLKNIYVGSNSADYYGGGLYMCPTGLVDVYLTSGGAFVNNRVTGNGIPLGSVPGADLLYKEASNIGASFFISSRILGGGSQKIYHDHNPRYKEGDLEADPLSYQNSTKALFLSNEISDYHDELAYNAAEFFIEHNHALVGGGIAFNGSMTIGQDESKTLTVSKKWDLIEKEELTSVKVDLLRMDSKDNPIVIETIELNESNDWTYKFIDLPAEYTYRVSEHEIEDYIPSYDVKEDGLDATIIITNADYEEDVDDRIGELDPDPEQKPDENEKTDEKEKLDEGEKRDEKEKTNEKEKIDENREGTKKNSIAFGNRSSIQATPLSRDAHRQTLVTTTTTSSSAPTSDDIEIDFWLLILILSFLSLTGTFIIKKRKKI